MNQDFRMGEIIATLNGLKSSMLDVKTDLREIKKNVDVLSSWKSKVVGISIATSSIVSMAGIAIEWLKSR